jgi:hypothetical protein
VIAQRARRRDAGRARPDDDDVGAVHYFISRMIFSENRCPLFGIMRA